MPNILSDDDLADVFLDAIATAGRLPRHAELYVATLSADLLVDHFRLSGLVVLRPNETRGEAAVVEPSGIEPLTS